MTAQKNTKTTAKKGPEGSGAQRSPDAGKNDTSNRFHKTFVTTKDGWSGADYQHDANKVAVLSEALNNGAHPLEEATFDGCEEHPDGDSLCLHYSVETKPAEDNPTSAETLSPSESEHTTN